MCKKMTGYHIKRVVFLLQAKEWAYLQTLDAREKL